MPSMANKSSPSLGSVIVIVLVARPVANVRLKAALCGGVGGAVAAQVPLAHHLGGGPIQIPFCPSESGM